MSTSIVERISKILNQAENAGTEAEAAVFMDKAQEMSRRYSVDLAKARHMTVAKERTVPITRHIVLGERKTRGLNTYVSLISGIANANDVKLNIAHNSTYVNLFGYEEDIDVVEALFGSLLSQMVREVFAFRKSGEWKQETVRVAKYEIDEEGGRYNRYTGRYNNRRYFAGYEYKPITWLSARLDFQQSFASRVGTRLYMAAAEARAAMTSEETGAESTGTELVLADKQKTVSDYYNAKSNHRGSYRGGRGISSMVASSAGRRAGDSARLTNSTSIGGTKGALSA